MGKLSLKNKKVLVTGACGFIGSHLVERLLDEGCSVRAFVFYNSFNSWGWLDSLPSAKLSNIDVFAGDIRDPNGVREAVKDAEVIFHLAALIGIPFSYHSPDSYVDTNVRGTLNVLQAAREIGVKRIIHTSTSEVYGTAQYVPMDEKHPLQAQSPYSASKTGADAMAESFYRSFKLPVCIARPFNTYGPRQSARAVIPTIITQIAAGHKKIILGDTRPTRDFNYVKDTCEGLVKIAECDKAVGGVINIGSNREISIGDIVSTIKSIMKSDAEAVLDRVRLRPEKSEVMRLFCDNSRITEMTGYKPRYSMERGLEETVRWFADPENLKRYKEERYNV